MSKLDEEATVKVKTPVGLTPEFTINRAIYQGSVLGPIKCSVSVDTLGRDVERDDSEQCVVYKYKNAVEIPPLAMVDDVLSVSLCGIKSIEMNAVINSKIEGKKLRLSEAKCHKIHVNNRQMKNHKCQTNLYAHDEPLKQVERFSYLGDIPSEKAGFEETIKSRAAKAIGIRSQIMSILKGISLGHFYFQIAFILRESLFINGILTNVETFSPLKQKDMKVFMKCDTELMKTLLNTNSFTYELLYRDTGKLPIQFIVAKKRFMYLWEILSRSKSEIIYKIYQIQEVKQTRGDWFLMMKEEREKYDINMTDDEIKSLSKQQFRNLVQKKIHQYAFKYLISLGKNHSKSQKTIASLKSDRLETQQ